MIIDIKPSPVKFKRYRATILKHDNTKSTSDGQPKVLYIDFGLKDGVTYIDKLPNGTPLRTNQERKNYLIRHLANKKEKYLIENLIPSPSLLSAALLWGPSRSLEKNVELLNKLWNS